MHAIASPRLMWCSSSAGDSAHSKSIRHQKRPHPQKLLPRPSAHETKPCKPQTRAPESTPPPSPQSQETPPAHNSADSAARQSPPGSPARPHKTPHTSTAAAQKRPRHSMRTPRQFLRRRQRSLPEPPLHHLAVATQTPPSSRPPIRSTGATNLSPSSPASPQTADCSPYPPAPPSRGSPPSSRRAHSPQTSPPATAPC